MRIKLPKEYSGRQILDAFRAAILDQNTTVISWEPKEEPDRVSYEISSAKADDIKTVVYRRASAVPLRKEVTGLGALFVRSPSAKMEGGEISLSPMHEHSSYSEFELFFKNVPPEKEGEHVGDALGLLVYHFLLKLNEELKKSEAVALAA